MASNAALYGSSSPNAIATSTPLVPASRGGPDGPELAKHATGDYVPEGYADANEFLTYCRDTYDADAAYDRKNREAALDDLRFIAGEQWDPTVRAERERQGRPCLQTNVLPTFIGQVIGDRRINSTTIKVRPKKDATVEMADTRAGIIKSIEAYSRAERVYDATCEMQVSCGIGNFRIDLDYATDDVFDQDIFIRTIPNPLAVIWDRLSVDPTGRDAKHCFVQDTMPRKEFEKRWPDQTPSDMGDGMASTLLANGWFDKDNVRITEYWCMIEKDRRIALMIDGKIEDVTDQDPAEYTPRLWMDPTTNKPRIRMAPRQYAQMHLITGFAILDGPYEVPLTRLPIIRAEGRMVPVGDDRVRYSLIRNAKDNQRLMNYADSVMAETISLSPKAQWFAPFDAVEGREDDFREGHRSGDPLLIFNPNASSPPQRVEPPAFPAAWAQLSQMNFQKIKDTTGLYDASLGQRSNEISGRAIQARQREGDVATVIYHDNLNAAIMEGGDVVNQLIPIAYDTVRTLRVIGPDDKHKLVKVNDPNDNESPDITSGKYDVSLETGPSYTTQRQEAADSMMQALQVAPQIMQVAGDLIVKAQDWPGAEEISERLKKTIPPQLLSRDDPDHPDNSQQQAAPDPAQQMQQQQMEMQMTELAEHAKHASALRQIEISQKMAELTKAEAEAAAAEESAPQASAATEKAEADAKTARANSVKAEHEAAQVPVEHAHRMRLAEYAAKAKIANDRNRSNGPRPAADRGKPAAHKKDDKK